jgi:hypothetical protein
MGVTDIEVLSIRCDSKLWLIREVANPSPAGDPQGEGARNTATGGG